RYPRRNRDCARNAQHEHSIRAHSGADAIADVFRDSPRDRRDSHIRRARTLVVHQQCPDHAGDYVAACAEQPRPRDVHVGHVRADHRRAYEANRRQLRDSREEPVLQPVVAGVVERVDTPRVNRAVAEGRADTVDALGDQEHIVMMRDEIQQERGDPQSGAQYVRAAPPEQVGERAGRHIGQEQYDEVRREDAVYLELVEPARTQENGIDAEQESAGERVQSPYRVVAAGDIANRRSMRSYAFHRNFPTQSAGPKAKAPGLASARGFLEPSINVRLNSGGPLLNWGLDAHHHSASWQRGYSSS